MSFVSKVMRGSSVLTVAGLVAGAGCLIVGLRMVYGGPDHATDPDEELDGFAELGGKMIGWPLILVGATIACVALAYFVTRAADRRAERVKPRAAKLPRASVEGSSRPDDRE